jgi:hypothetical protein
MRVRKYGDSICRISTPCTRSRSYWGLPDGSGFVVRPLLGLYPRHYNKNI